MLNDESLEAKRRILVEKQIRAAELFVKKKVSREAILEREIKKQKEAHTNSKMAAIKEQQKDDLDTGSDDIRHYLMNNLVPILTDGLMEICKAQPGDPVDSLAEYLFKRSLDVPYKDPIKYFQANADN